MLHTRCSDSSILLDGTLHALWLLCHDVLDIERVTNIATVTRSDDSLVGILSCTTCAARRNELDIVDKKRRKRAVGLSHD